MFRTGGTPGYDVSATLGHPVNTRPQPGAMPRPFWPRVLRLWGEFWESGNKPEGPPEGWRPSQRHFLSRSLLRASVNRVLADHLQSAPTFPAGVNSSRAAGGPFLLVSRTQPGPHTWHCAKQPFAQWSQTQGLSTPSHFPPPQSPWTEV